MNQALWKETKMRKRGACAVLPMMISGREAADALGQASTPARLGSIFSKVGAGALCAAISAGIGNAIT
jgi:hypothetical protein